MSKVRSSFRGVKNFIKGLFSKKRSVDLSAVDKVKFKANLGNGRKGRFTFTKNEWRHLENAEARHGYMLRKIRAAGHEPGKYLGEKVSKALMREPIVIEEGAGYWTFTDVLNGQRIKFLIRIDFSDVDRAGVITGRIQTIMPNYGR